MTVTIVEDFNEFRPEGTWSYNGQRVDIQDGALEISADGPWEDAYLLLDEPMLAPEISVRSFLESSGGGFGGRFFLKGQTDTATYVDALIELTFEADGTAAAAFRVRGYQDSVPLFIHQVSQAIEAADFVEQWSDISIAVDAAGSGAINVDLNGDGFADLSFENPALQGFSMEYVLFGAASEWGTSGWHRIDDLVITGTSPDDTSALTAEEFDTITRLWDTLAAYSGAFETFGEGFGTAYKALTNNASFLDSATGAAQWMDMRLLRFLPGGVQDGAQDLLNTLTDYVQGARDFDALLDAVRAYKGAGRSLLGLTSNALQVIEALDYAKTTLEAVTSIMNGDLQSATGSAFDLTTALATGAAVTHLIGTTAVTVTAVAVTGGGLGALIMVGGVAVAVGFGLTLAAEAIEEQFDLVERVQNLTEEAALKLVFRQTEGWFADWDDTTPHPSSAVSDAQNAVLWGRAGNDDLTGMGGNDTLVGWRGRDTLDGGGGADEMRGGDGADLYIVDDARDRVVEVAFDFGRREMDTVEASITYILPRSVDHLILTGSSRIDGTGNKQDNHITGNGASNTLDGREGADTLYGMGGDDNLIVAISSAREEVHGGDGTDTLIVDSLKAGMRIDLVNGTAGTLMNTRISGIEDVRGGLGNDSIIGNAVNNYLQGGEGKDTISGGGGADTIHGGRRKDSLSAGDDRAADVFLFLAVSDLTGGFGRETISQFDLNRDYLDFSFIDANSARSGDQDFGFANRATANAIWTKALRGGAIEVSGDVTGDGKADFSLKLVDLLTTDGSSPGSLQGIFVL